MDLLHLLGIAIILSLVCATAFFRLSRFVWTPLIGVSLLALSIYGFLNAYFLLIFWLGFLVAASFANLTSFRRQHIMVPLIHYLKATMPPISTAEREAIEAGDTWWEKELFCGRPNWKQLLAMRTPELSEEEQQFIDHQVETLCGMLNDWQIVYEEKRLPDHVWSYIVKEKFLGLVIPKRYGGLGFSALAHSSIIQKISSRSPSTAVSTMVPNSLGPGEMLLHYGTDAQKDYYLPRLARGEEIPCFALTAPDAGSDASAIPDSGIVCKGMFDGKEVIGIKLSWDKRYITLAPISTLIGVAFHLYDPDHLMGEKDDVGITLCLIPATTPGVEVGTRHYPLLQAFMNGPTRGKDVFVPLEYIIGGSKMAGKGWKMLMEGLSIGRSISLPALSTAASKLAYRYTGAYARIRYQFNVPISSFEGIQEALGYIAGYTYTLEACRMMTTGAVDQHLRPPIASAIAKYHMTEMGRKVVAHAMDVHGGHMIQAGPRNFLAFQHIAFPICITVEGANILTRNLIIFGQGAIRCHPYVLKEMALLSAEVSDIPTTDTILMSHIGYFASNLLRSFFYGLTGGKLIFKRIKHSRVATLQKQLTRMSSALAVLSDTSMMLLGGSLKRRERISARLGDILSQLYIASTVLKYFYDLKQPDTDVDSVCWALQDCLKKIQIAIDGLLKNFPNRWVALLLRCCIFPYGRAYDGPSDQLHHKIVENMLSPSAFRDRLTRGCYQSSDPNELIARLDTALNKIDAVSVIWTKVQNAVKHGKIPKRYNASERIQAAYAASVITKTEAEVLTDFEALKNEIIRVNEFSFDLKEVIA